MRRARADGFESASSAAKSSPFQAVVWRLISDEFFDLTRSLDRHGRGVDYSIALVERLSAIFIMLIGFEWVRPRLTPGT
jgi:hypothetical protein